MNYLLEIRDKETGEIVASGEIAKHAGEYLGVFTDSDGKITAQVQVEECGVWSLATALLKVGVSE